MNGISSGSSALVRHNVSLADGAWVCREQQRVAAGASCVYAAIADSFWGSIDFSCVFIIAGDAESSVRLHLRHALGQRAPKLVEASATPGYAVSVTHGHPPHCIIRATVLRSDPVSSSPPVPVLSDFVHLPVKLLPPPTHMPPPPPSPPSGGGTSAGESSFLSFVSRSIAVNIVNSTNMVFELLSVDVTEGVALAPQPAHVSSSSCATLAFNSDHVSGGVACSLDIRAVGPKEFRLKLRVENPLIGRSSVSAFSSDSDSFSVEYVDGSHCVVTCSATPATAALPSACSSGNGSEIHSSSWSPLRISSYCCSSASEPSAPHATPSALAEALVAAGRPDVLVLQGCSADAVRCVASAFNVSLSSASVLLSPPPPTSSNETSLTHSGASAAIAVGGHVIISLAEGAGLELQAACSWEGLNQHASCSALAIPRVSATSPDVWIVSVNLSSFDVDVDKRMDTGHEETVQSLCQWLQALLAARRLPVILSGFFGIPAEDPVSTASSSSLSDSVDFSRMKSLLHAVVGVVDVIDVFRSSNAGSDAGLTWDYTQNSTIESFDRLFARDSFVFIINPLGDCSRCSPITCSVKPLGTTPATRISPHFGLMAMIKLLAANSAA
jgi:hypothetical protein